MNLPGRRSVIRRLRGNVGLSILLLVIVAADVHLYFHNRFRPIPTRNGWESFWDQGQYLRSARALARGNLRADEHWYPIGYSALAVPWVYVTPRDPFVLVNVLSFAVFAGAFLTYFRPAIGLLPAACVFVIALAWPLAIRSPVPLEFPIWSQFIIPWSTIPVAAIYMCVLCLLLRLESARGVWIDATLGVLTAITFAIRPGDTVPLLALAPFYVWRRLSGVSPRQAVGRIASASAATVVPVALVLGLTIAIHGGLTSPYVELVRWAGMSFSDIHERAYAIFLSSAATFGEAHNAVFELQPWLFLAVPLAVVWAARDVRRGLPPLLLVVVSCVLYLSFNDFWPFNILRFFVIHYIVWTLPVVAASGLAGGLAIVRGRHWKIGLAVAALALAMACWRVEPTALDLRSVAVTPVDAVSTGYVLKLARVSELDAIDLAGAWSPNQIGLTSQGLTLTINGRPLDLVSGYRMIQLDGGIRVVLNRHVSSAIVVLVLNGGVYDHPRSASQVRAVRFDSRFVPFWLPKPVAAIE